ncbi:hypothetical protein AAG570_005555 [Ranatra chinensis]|uniref:Uncharacterized protein n=1 Tax=Ranatra chinensis TaxID=642074 RepID=A0ABD0YLC8_9HEMI
MGDKPTNRRDKPEWYFTKIEFLSGMVQMAVDKLERDLEHVQFDDTLFSHTVDEALGFDRELRDLYPYPAALPSAASVLTQAQVFVKWIQMESKFARDKMRRMLSSATAWSEVCLDNRTTEVNRTYLAILSSMTDRYSALLQPGHKLQFVDLQIELTKELCLSFEEVLQEERQGDALNSRLPAVLNTASYLMTSLQQWQATPEMLLLEHYKDQYVDKTGSEGLDSDENSGIFQSVLNRLEVFKKESLDTLCNAIMYEVKAETRPYRKDR